MGRGASQQGSTAIFYGDNGPRGTDLDSLLEVELTGKQQIAARALLALEREHPSAPGFEAYDINEAAEPFERQTQEWLPLSSIGDSPFAASSLEAQAATRAQAASSWTPRAAGP